jgi:hypothetical protein
MGDSTHDLGGPEEISNVSSASPEFCVGISRDRFVTLRGQFQTSGGLIITIGNQVVTYSQLSPIYRRSLSDLPGFGFEPPILKKNGSIFCTKYGLNPVFCRLVISRSVAYQIVFWVARIEADS